MDRCGADWVIIPTAIAMSSNETIEPVYYQSRYTHGLDDKRRVPIPAKWRAPLAETPLTLILWPQGAIGPCLLALTPDTWRELVGRIKAMPFGDPKAEALRRILGRDSDSVKLDGSGRICLSETMAKAAGIEKQALFLGLLDRFQIWAPERYEKVAPLDDNMAPEAFKLI